MKSRLETGDWRLEEKDKTFWDATGIERGDPHARPGAVCKQHLCRWLGGLRMTALILVLNHKKALVTGLGLC